VVAVVAVVMVGGVQTCMNLEGAMWEYAGNLDPYALDYPVCLADDAATQNNVRHNIIIIIIIITIIIFIIIVIIIIIIIILIRPLEGGQHCRGPVDIPMLSSTCVKTRRCVTR
jgi:hypothetical protein